MKNHLSTPNSVAGKGQNEDKHFLLKTIRRQVVKYTGEPLETILMYPELRRYRLALECCTTTNKAVCCAMFIPVEAGTRYKAHLEKNGYLVSSIDQFNCPVTGDKAHQIGRASCRERV